MVVILCHMGPFPDYIGVFLDSASRNSGTDFLIVTDQENVYKTGDNVRWFEVSNQDLIDRINNNIGLNINYNIRYKICDFKPTYGVIFSDLVADYAYWAYTDPDVVWGSVDRVLSGHMSDGVDIFSTRGEYWLAGAFTMFKNDSHINNMFRLSDAYRDVLSDSKTRRFAETCGMWKGEFFDRDLKSVSESASMSDIVNFEYGIDNVKYNNEYVIREYKTKRQWSYGDFEIVSDGTRLLDRDKEILLFHMVFVKNDSLFYVPRGLPESNKYVIDSRGIMPARRGEDRFGASSISLHTGRYLSAAPKAIKRIASRVTRLVRRNLGGARNDLRSRPTPQAPSAR